MSATSAAGRPGYFADPTSVPVAHPPSGLRGIHQGRGRHLFTVSRLDAPKRIDLIVRAMAHVQSGVELHIAGTGPQEGPLRELAAGDPRIHLLGYLNDARLVDAYASAIAVPFVPDREDYGYITLEAMLSGKPVTRPPTLVVPPNSSTTASPDSSSPLSPPRSVRRWTVSRRVGESRGVSAPRERAARRQ